MLWRCMKLILYDLRWFAANFLKYFFHKTLFSYNVLKNVFTIEISLQCANSMAFNLSWEPNSSSDSSEIKFYGNRRFNTVFTRAQNVSLSWAALRASVLFVPLKSFFKTLLPFTPDPSKFLFPSIFPTKILYAFLFPLTRNPCPAYLILLDLIVRKIRSEVHKS